MRLFAAIQRYSYYIYLCFQGCSFVQVCGNHDCESNLIATITKLIQWEKLLLLLLCCHSPHRTVGILLCAFSLATTIPPSVHFLMLSIQPVFLRPGLVFPSTSPSTVIWTRLSDRGFQCPYIDSFLFLNWASRPSSSDTPTLWRIHTLVFLSFQSTWSILRHTHNSNDSTFFMSLCFKVQLSAP